MSSFEQLIVEAQRQTEFDTINDAILKIVMSKSDHFALCNKIQPFLQHINDGGHLNSLYTQLQNPFNENSNKQIIYTALIHNVVHASKSDNKLKRVLELIARN